MSDNQQFCLRWNNHQSTLVQVIDSLLSSGVLVDCTLAAEGQYLHAHKVVLCACSPYLETLLSQHYEKHPIVILKDVKFQELKSMMDYMYKGEVNISQDQLGQFLKAAESLQIKGLTDGGGGENDAKDVGTTSHNKRHDPPPIRKSVPPNQSRSSVVLPSHGTGLTIEPSKRTIPSHLSESQPDSPIRSREGSSSPTPRKRRRPRRPSQGDDDGHQDNCDLPMQQQSILNTVPIIPQLPAGSSSTITKAPPPDDEPDQPAESDVRLAESGLLKEKIEPQSELLIEPKTEYMEETNNDDSVEDLTLDDDDEYDNMDGAGPSHGGDNSNQSYGQWQMGERTHDDVFMAAQEAVGGGPRDSQDKAARITITREQSQRLQKLLREKPAGKCKYTDEEVRRNASRFKIPSAKIRHFLRLHNALDEGGANRRVPRTVIDLCEKQRSPLLNKLSFEKKVLLLRKTASMTRITANLTRELSRELGIPENKMFNWLRHKLYRNQRLKKSLSTEDAATLDKKLADYDYLDDDSALLLADRFNVSSAVIKKAFQKRRPSSIPLSRPVVELKKYQIPDSLSTSTVTTSTSTTLPSRRTKAAAVPERTDGGNNNWKTQSQKNILFEAFRESPAVVKSQKVVELAKATGLTNLQVSKWLSLFRGKWAKSNESSLKRMLSAGLTADQLHALEKKYRQTRFLTLTQVLELTHNTGAPRRAIQAWFTQRRLYEIHSGDKDLVKIEHKTPAAKKEPNEMRMLQPSISIPQSCVPTQQPSERPQVSNTVEDPEANEFFDSLTKEQKAYLKSCTKNFNVSYKKVARTLNLPESKVALFIKSYRVSHSMIRRNKSSLPERVQKVLLNHYLKYGKISSNTSQMLSQRLNVRPQKIFNWGRQHYKRLRGLGKLVEMQSDVEQSEPVAEAAEYYENGAEAAECYENGAEAAEYYENATEPVIATTSKTESLPARKSSRHYFTTAENKTIMFKEFKKSPQGAANKSKQIAQATNLTVMQVRKWLYNFGRKISEQKKSKVEANLNTAEISAEARARLEHEYKSRKFLEEDEMDSLAAEFRMLRKHVSNWFMNARYYEILTGQCPASGSSTVKRSAAKPTIASKPAPVAAKPPPVVKFVYEELDAETQARLNNELKSYPFDDDKLNNLADELQIPSVELKKWFEGTTRSTRSRRRSSAPATNLPADEWYNLTTKQMQTLLSEFEADPILTEVRTVNMAKRIKVTKERIKAWFEHRRLELRREPTQAKQTVPPITIIMPKWSGSGSGQEMPTIAPQPQSTAKKTSKSSKKSYEFKVPNQLNMLFEEFKMSPHLTNERLLTISERTNLSGKQITSWFNWLNHRLSALPRDSLLEENRNKYLTVQQIDILEQHYAQVRYMNRSAREALSVELGVPKAVIKSWFESRRNYELLCENDEQPTYFTETQGQFESVLNYDYDDESTAVKEEETVDLEPKFDPLMDLNQPAEESVDDVEMEQHSFNFQLESNGAFLEDLTSLPYQPRSRFITPLDKDLEPTEQDTEKIFWLVNKTPNKINPAYNQDIDEAKNRILENEFSKNPWVELERISELSAQLLVSEPKLHWWFIKKRCFLTKTILTIPPSQPKPKPKNVLIDLTDDDAVIDDSQSQPTACGQFEFVTAEEAAQIKEEEDIDQEPLSIQLDTSENGDPFENNALNESIDSEEFSLQIPVESTNDTSSASASSVVKKKKKRIPLTSHQCAVLTKELKTTKDVPIAQVRLLAQDLGLSVARIQAWFETMRKSSTRKKAKLESTSLVKSLDPELESALEVEYTKSANLSDKRAKMIAIRLKTQRKLVKKWFAERAKKKDDQTMPLIMKGDESMATKNDDESVAAEKDDESVAMERDESMETEISNESMETAKSDLSTETEKDEESMLTENVGESMETQNNEESTTTVAQ